VVEQWGLVFVPVLHHCIKSDARFREVGEEYAELYLHSPIRLHGMVHSQAHGQIYLYLTKLYVLSDYELC